MLIKFMFSKLIKIIYLLLIKRLYIYLSMINENIKNKDYFIFTEIIYFIWYELHGFNHECFASNSYACLNGYCV